MRILFAILTLAVSLRAIGATYYVDGTNGAASDANVGSAAEPWLTIGHAVTNATAGDTVIIQPATYSEWLTNIASGTDGSPITFTGVRGGDGAWLTIVDPSTDASSGWYTNAALGGGIFTNATIPFTVRSMTIAGQMVLGHTNGDFSAQIATFYDTNWATGIEVMGLPSATVVGSKAFGTTNYFEFWDGIEAMFCSTGTVTYLRLRDGSSPEGLDIQVAPNADGFEVFTPTRPAWRCDQDFITVSNLLIRNAFASVLLDGAHHVSVASNHFLNAQIQVYLGNGAYANTIHGNRIETDYYGGQPGAWEGGSATAEYQTKSTMYLWPKVVGLGATYYNGLSLYNSPGASNSVTANWFKEGVGQGIILYGGATPAGWTKISSNTFERFASVGAYLESHHTNTLIFDNLFSDCNANIRTIYARDEPMRSVYAYRNRFYLPTDIGEHFGIYYSGTPQPLQPTFWIYHNSASGGRYWVHFGSGAVADSGATNTFVINNITANVNLAACEAGFATDAAMMGAWDYNLHGPYAMSPDPDWFLAHNIKATTNQWSNSEGMSYVLTANSQAIDAALDTSAAFTVNSRNFGALSDTAIKIGPQWDMGGLEYNGNEVPPILRFGTMRSAP